MRYLVMVGLMLGLAGGIKAQTTETRCITNDGERFTCTTTRVTTPTDIGNSIVQAQVAANAVPVQGQSVYAQRRDACKASGPNYKWHPWKGLYGSCELKK